MYTIPRRMCRGAATHHAHDGDERGRPRRPTTTLLLFYERTSQGRRVSSFARTGVLLTLCVWLLHTGSPRALGGPTAPSTVVQAASPGTQTDTTGVAWRLIVDGAPTDGPDVAPSAPVDSARQVARDVIRRFHRSGYYHARIDSVVVDTSTSTPDGSSCTSRRPCASLFLTRGQQVVVGRVQVRGADSLGNDRLRSLIDVSAGAPLDPEALERSIDDMLNAYEAEGYPLARVLVDSFDVRPEQPRLDITLRVDEGPALWLRRLSLPASARTSPRFVARIARLELGEPLRNYDPVRVRKALEQTGLFASVGVPELRVGAGGGATLFVPVTESAPGAFDAVLGYLPPTGGSEDGQIVGTGQLALRNLFGAGRRLRLQLDRRPQQTSLVDVEATDPYVAGWSIRADLGFRGEQRDSTFAQRIYRVAVGPRPSPDWSLSATVSREVTRPGQGGTQIVQGEQRVPRASAFFYGVTARLERVDDPRNPRRGIRVEVTAEQGRKRRSLRRVVDADTLRDRETLRQERLELRTRGYLPVFARQSIALGVDANLLRSDAYDTSDLFRIGGAQSLRGSDEDRYVGRITARALLEYRVRIDRVSYAFLFTDLGFVDTPETTDLESEQRVLPGYGFGLQFGTPLGIANLSYALGPDDSPARGRIHLGVSVGL